MTTTKIGAVLALAAALAGCRDQLPDGRRGAPPATGPRANVSPAVQYGTYWRSPDVLWVYDRTPEVGIAATPAKYGHVPNLGMRLVRWTLYWTGDSYADQMANARQQLDGALQAAGGKGIELVVVVHNPGQCVQRFADPYGSYAQFMEGIAGEYPQVRFWELWNEMDVNFTNFFGGPSPNHANGTPICAAAPVVSSFEQGRRYASMLQRTYPRIKGANPSAWVLLGGLAGSTDFLEGVYQGGGAPFFDIMNRHAYGDVGHEAVSKAGQKFMEVMTRNGDELRPFWLTEFGSGADDYPGDAPQTGARYDAYQAQWWNEALDVVAGGLYFTKAIGYFLDGHDYAVAPEAAVPLLPATCGRDDYGAGILWVERPAAVAGDQCPDGQPRPAYAQLQARNFNAAVRSVPLRYVDVRVYSPDRNPVGYSYVREGSGTGFESGFVTIQGVAIDNLAPTVVRFQPVGGGGGGGGAGPAFSGWSPASGSTLDPDPVLSFQVQDAGGMDPASFRLTVDGVDWRSNAAPPTLTGGGTALAFWSNVVNLPRGQWFTLAARACNLQGACSTHSGSYYVNGTGGGGGGGGGGGTGNGGTTGNGPQFSGWAPAEGSTVQRDPVFQWTASDAGGIDAGSFQFTMNGTDWRSHAAPPTPGADGKTLVFWSNVVDLPTGPVTLRVRLCNNSGACTERWASYTVQ